MFMLLNCDRRYMRNLRRTFSVLAASGLSLFTLSCAPSNSIRAQDQPAAVPVRTAVVRLTTVTDTFQVPGTVKARTQTVLSSKVVGQIISLPVREGDRIHRGELVVEVEGHDAFAQLRRAQAGEAESRRALEEVDGAIRAAEAALRGAEANCDLTLATRKRYDVLRERRSISPQEFDEVETRYKAALSDMERARETLGANQARRLQALARIEQAEAEVEAALVAVGYLKITSPIDGVVTARKAEPGMLATPGMPLLVIDDDSTYQLESIVEESRAACVRAGQNARVEIDALSAALDAHVSEIVPASDPATRTYIVKLDLALTPVIRRNLHSGFFGRALFQAGDRQALVVPESALVRRGQLTGVYVVQNDAATLRLIKTGKRYDTGFEILSGLTSGVRIVVAAAHELSDGVRVIEEIPEGTTP